MAEARRKDLMVGNWKMNANHLEAIQMVQKLSFRLNSADSTALRWWCVHLLLRFARCRY